MVGEILETSVPIFMHILELMGVFIIFITAVKAFVQYALKLFNVSDDVIKIELAKALALGLEFLLGGEILKSLMIRTIDELVILASIMGLRIILTFVIHWETKADSQHCNSFLELKEKYNKQIPSKFPLKRKPHSEQTQTSERTHTE